MGRQKQNWRKSCTYILLCILLLLPAGCGSGSSTDYNFENANRVEKELQDTSQQDSTDSSAQENTSDEIEKKESGDAAKEETTEKKEQQKDSSSKEKEDTAASQDKKETTKKLKNASASVTQNQKATKKTSENATESNPYVVKSDGTDKGQDQYKTDPVPEGEQLPVEPGNVTVDKDQALTCSLTVECKTVLNNMDKLKKGKESIIPKDGIIYQNTAAVFYEGESVSDILIRELKNHSIHYEFTFTPGYNSDYIEGIGNLYEFDCGSFSGWNYFVNSWSPNYGCSRYIVQQGDEIEWRYTCNLGKDLVQ